MQNSNELDEAKQAMQTCQKNKGYVKIFREVEYSTCEPCDEIFTCTIRKKYVDMVYFSMNANQEGGFEF